MLEEYLCLGGTEIANNARAYGYATTSGCPVSWFRCEPCDSLREATGDWIPPTYRVLTITNLIGDPRGVTPATTWGTNGGTATTMPSGGVSWVISNATYRFGPEVSLLPNTQYTYSVVVESTVTLTVSLQYRTTMTTAGVALQTMQLVANQPTTVTTTFTTDATAPTSTAGLYFHGTNGTVGQTLKVSSPIVVLGNVGTNYFDGDTPDGDPSPYFEWTGAANASPSTQNTITVDIPGHTTNPQYIIGNITDAPWYDADVPASTRFYGVYIISIENLNSSTRSAGVTEGILDGGVVGLVRHTTREVRTRATLVAEGDDALEYGLAWLSAALATNDCGTHGSTCGSADLQFFAYCPDAPDPQAPSDNDGQDTWDMELRAPRFLHGVTVTSGPLVERYLKSNNNRHVGYIVEWTMVAATPWVFGVTSEVSLTASAPIVVQDTPFNLMPYPSAELSAGTVVVQTNYSANPSVETNATGWVVGSTVITPVPTGARSTEVAADGIASFKVSVTTTNSGTNGSIRAYQDITLPAEVSGQRFSVTEWGFMAVVSGTAVLGPLQLTVQWLDAGGATLSTFEAGTGAASGGAISSVGMTRTPGATKARIWMIGNVASWSTGAVLNLFADALALTSP
jgi:hypothetical protein